MGRKQLVVDLSEESRQTIDWFIMISERKAEDINRGRILQKIDDRHTVEKISEHDGCRWKTAYNARKADAD